MARLKWTTLLGLVKAIRTQQGPLPQELEADVIDHIVARVGVTIGLNGFSSMVATRE